MQGKELTYHIKDVSLSDIEFPVEELRSRVFFEDLDELAQSIRSVGLMNPLTVRVHGDKYQLIAGYRRLKAAEIRNLAVVPVRIVNADDATADMQQLHENMFREAINPIDEGKFFKRLLLKNKWRIMDLAVQVHKSPSYVSKRINLTEGDPAIVQALQDNVIGLSIADELSKIDDPDTRARLLHYAVTSGATVETVRMWRMQYQNDLIQASYPPAEGGSDPVPFVPRDPSAPAKFGEEPPPSREMQERFVETRPCFGCMEKTNIKEIFTVYLCPVCYPAIEQALRPPPEAPAQVITGGGGPEKEVTQ